MVRKTIEKEREKERKGDSGRKTLKRGRLIGVYQSWNNFGNRGF